MTELSMDFSLDEEQRVVAELAASVFAGHSSDDRVVRTENDGTTHDAPLWTQLVSTGLLDAALPEAAGGGGLGTVGLALIAQQQGRHLSRVPFVPTAVIAMALGAFANDHGDVLDGIRRGSVRVAIATPELCTGVTARVDGDGWVLTGRLSQAYLAGSCTHVVVCAPGASGDAGDEPTFLLELDRAGMARDEHEGISRNIHASIVFDDVRVDRRDLLASPSAGRDTGRWVRERFLVGLAALEVGLCTEALRRTADYVSQREQFGRPLSTNQGVAMRAADAHIDTEAMSVTMFDAAWRLDHDPDVDGDVNGDVDHDEDTAEAVEIATWWAREAGFRVVHATQHLHGGIGADTDNHIHRFFLWARELDIIAGPAPAHLAALGDLLATEATT